MAARRFSQRIAISLLFGIFTAASSLLIVLAHVNYLEVIFGTEYAPTTGFTVNYGVVSIVAAVVFIASIAAQTLTVNFSMKRKVKPNDVIYPVIGFVAQLVIGYSGLLFLPLPSAWENVIGVPIYAGIAAISLHIFLYLDERRKTIELLVGKDNKDKTNVVKSLELEHEILQSSLQWIVSLSSLFVIGGVVAVAFNRDALLTPDIHEVILRNIVTLAIVAIIGLWFGVVMQLFGQMRWIRETIEQIEPKAKTE